MLQVVLAKMRFVLPGPFEHKTGFIRINLVQKRVPSLMFAYRSFHVTGKIFLSATHIRSQLLSYHGLILHHRSLLFPSFLGLIV